MCPRKKVRAQGRPGGRCTRGLAQKRFAQAQEPQVQAVITRPSLRDGLRLIGALLGEPMLVCHRCPCAAFASLGRVASVGATGPHHFAVRLGAARQQAHPRPPHSAPRFVTIAIRPSHRPRNEAEESTKFGKLEEIYFCADILTEPTVLNGLANPGFSRRAALATWPIPTRFNLRMSAIAGRADFAEPAQTVASDPKLTSSSQVIPDGFEPSYWIERREQALLVADWQFHATSDDVCDPAGIASSLDDNVCDQVWITNLA